MPKNISISFSAIITIFYLFNRLNRNIAGSVISWFEMPIKKTINFTRLFYSTTVLRKSRNLQVWPTYCMPQSFSSQDKILITSVDLQSRSELVITENCLPLTLDLVVDLQHKCLQHLHLLALNLEIEVYTTLLLYLPLEFLSTGDLRGKRRTFKWFLKQREESETPCK